MVASLLTATATFSPGAAAAPQAAPQAAALTAAAVDSSSLRDGRSKHRFRVLRPRSAQGAIMLSAFGSALLAITPPSAALVVTPSAQAAATLAGRHGRYSSTVGRADTCYASRATSVFAGTRSVPSRAAVGRGCSSLLVLASAGCEDGVEEGDGHVEEEGERALGESGVVGGEVEIDAGQLQTKDDEEEGQEVVANNSETRCVCL